jgi:hypothetical protein
VALRDEDAHREPTRTASSTACAIAANVHCSKQMAKLLLGQEREVSVEQAYWNESLRQSALAAGIR